MKKKFTVIFLSVLISTISGIARASDAEKWTEPVSGIEFTWLAGGCFTMGQGRHESAELMREAGKEKYDRYYSDELPRHQVCVSGFWIATTETTQRQWLRVENEAPFKPDPISTIPAGDISWNDAVAYADKLNNKNGRVTFRLPTEAEWEYAARGGSDTPFATGNVITTAQANFNGLYVFGDGVRGKFRESPTPAATFNANAFGLYDMHGNVWEWCNDWYAKTAYRSAANQDPKGPAHGKKRVLRGGSWYTKPRSIRSANRYADKPETRVNDYGMRLVADKEKPRKQSRRDMTDPEVF